MVQAENLTEQASKSVRLHTCKAGSFRQLKMFPKTRTTLYVDKPLKLIHSEAADQRIIFASQSSSTRIITIWKR